MKILIAGGSGLIGTKLRELLKRKGHEVALLSRNPEDLDKGTVFRWNIKEQYIDPRAFDNVDVLLNLAGAGIADARWSQSRKEILRASRVDGNNLLVDGLQAAGVHLSLFVGAAAIGIYGDRGDECLTEQSKLGSQGFLVSLCKEWEESYHAFRKYSKRSSVVRIGMVLSDEGGALPRLNESVIMGCSGYLGSGTQYMSWIHILDLTRILLAIIENPELSGTMNATSPHPVTNREFIRTLLSFKRGPGILLPVPKMVLKILLGEMSQVLLDSSRVLPEVLTRYNFSFEYGKVEEALRDLIK